MTKFEPVGRAPEPPARAGFVPCQFEDPVAAQLLRPLFGDDRETLVLAGFDAFERLVGLIRIDGDRSGRCIIPPQCWRSFIDDRIVTVVMAHNHPSGNPEPSAADTGTTQEAAIFLRTLGVELVDHLIFVAGGHFSFRTAEML
ncbi:JAB domain-containing protein [Sphingopyxis sp. JAI128]|uniref:JAB domain-containing protein n=1 Tax=Sphingopyxis sp. JAI128 TaxID=2723066 RepID=UPI001621EAE5|nr:JAB domain-containing protein [Sphingopyxis sp. JAI128]MBB6424609.1 DNA repair protein RadC [Sphingopyxis sp. JAI128]